ncbi:S-layer homology domain-containing protein [Allisonella histaminiformans]|uniref:S-layer homology domain-containing protein n=1 Tax=Allisonella histaminiformans TaxID=209880 RepID=UPI002E7947B3|nr:S-layer homology domain-containing protein [Allisonella histaminiformans]
MKRLPFGAALAALMLTTSFVMADNAFSDVTPDDWSYKAVSQLADEGVIDGYPDGTFKGNKNITRYEMGQIVARLMAKEDTLTADQKATLDKLSTDYAGELDNLGVRVDKLENQVFKDTTFIYDLRASAMPSYDNIFKDSDNDHDDSMGFRFRVNSYTKMSPRLWLYGQLETHMSMNGKSFTGVNATDEDDSEFKLNRFFTTYHWGDVKDHYLFDKGPTDDNIIIGRFPMRMGVTGYTYDGEFTGIGVQFGDYFKGGALRIATGRANNINYDYTGPMMHGVAGMKAAASQLAGALAKPQLTQAGMSAAQADALSKVIAGSINRTTNMNDLAGNIKSDVSQALTASTVQTLMNSGYSKEQAITMAGAAYQHQTGQTIDATSSAISSTLVGQFQTSERLQTLASGLDWSNGTYYPMSNVHMPWGDDEDVPVTFISYKFVAPKQYEIHLYGAKVNGSVDPIAKAWGGALSYNINDHLSIHGEYLKNMRRLPLNNEKPHSFNFGITFGDVDILKPHSYAFTLDHVYSQAGTYFGGSSSDVADQYMGHIYKHWKFHGIDMGKIPAYLADKMNAVAAGTDTPDSNYGGAKFNLARFEYVPMKGLKLKAEYGFKAEDMGDRKMENVWYVEAQAYFM